MAAHEANQLELVQRYQKLVQAYQALDARIDKLMLANRRRRDQMSAADLSRYRQWARERSEILNDMRLLEQQLNLDADDGAAAR